MKSSETTKVLRKKAKWIKELFKREREVKEKNTILKRKTTGRAG